MKILVWKKLSPRQRHAALARPAPSARRGRTAAVARILAEVRRDGDAALRRLTEKFDGVRLSRLRVSAAEFAAARKLLTSADRTALRTAYRNLVRFHRAQKTAPVRVETTAGMVCEKETRPQRAVGLYVPGGSAPLFSTALMLGVPAQLAGCPQRALCTPPGRDGRVSPWILAAAELCGIRDVFKVGGAQAIAALACGTGTIPRCDKLFGPGNAFVTEAKLQVSQTGCAIDLPAGPSEVMVVADDRARADFVAADLLSQAEHGPDSQVILVAFSRMFAERVRAEIERQLASLPRRAIARRALAASRLLIADREEDAVAIADAYAPEHLILQIAQPRRLARRVRAAGSIFLGPWTPESLGDYASGTNHVLPTGGWATACSGLGLADFQRTLTLQSASTRGLARLGPVVARLARAENLEAHARAVEVRLRRISR
ncbi:MAG TPA: histidinol dehydrogenase [Candidatus Didemnitutus sp.]|jgi:histidinol dehydrogenase